MRSAWIIVALTLLAAGCGADDEVLAPLADPGERAAPQGALVLPTTVWAENPRATLSAGKLHRYDLQGKKDGVVTLRMRAADCDALTPALYLFGPSGGVSVAHAGGADTDCAEGALIQDFQLPSDGLFAIVVSAHEGSGHYQLDASCTRGACQPEGTMTFPQSRQDSEGQTDEGALNEIGRFLFEHVYRVSEGLGNDIYGTARPNFNAIHRGPFGGPDAQSCVSCHNLGAHGAGPRDANIFQAGDGDKRSNALKRNPPPLRGLGLREALAADISLQLTDQLHAALDEAIASAEAVAATLCVPSLAEPVCFGDVVALPDGTINTDGTKSLVDIDLVDDVYQVVVRPFGWKGREQTLRGFVRGGFRVHFGLQAATPIAMYCEQSLAVDDPVTETFSATWGNPIVTCLDPDRDGFEDEITDGQLDAMAVYLKKLDPPSASTEDAPEAFYRAGCADCHTRGFSLEGAEVQVWSDFRRHHVGSAIGDLKPFVNPPGPDIAETSFITPPLWDVATSAPYMHDGRAETLLDAIDLHALGEANASRDLFFSNELTDADREEVLTFLRSLGARN